MSRRGAVVALAGSDLRPVLGPWRADHHLALARKLAAKDNDVAGCRQILIARKLSGDVPVRLVDDLRKRRSEQPKRECTL